MKRSYQITFTKRSVFYSFQVSAVMQYLMWHHDSITLELLLSWQVCFLWTQICGPWRRFKKPSKR